MKYTLIPSVIAKNQAELDKRLEKISSLSKVIQLDVMDGDFVKAHSLDFDFITPTGKSYESHLMINSPEEWINENANNSKIIFFHIESAKNPSKIINFIKRKRKKVGIVINPKTPIRKIISYLEKVDALSIMTVSPGKYGAEFLPETLAKVRQIREINKKIDIEVDGGINEKTILKAKQAGANHFVVGSYLQNSSNPKKDFIKLKNKLKL